MTPSSTSAVRSIYLLGCGGHGRVVLDSLLVAGAHIAGIVDAALTAGEIVHGVAVLGGDECLERLDPREAALCIGVGVMPGSRRRRDLFDSCGKRGFTIVSVVHPSAVISRWHEFGRGVHVLAGAIVQSGVSLGDNVIVNTGARVDHDCKVGKDVMIGPGATVCGQVHIGEGAYVGAGCVLLPGVSVGRHAILGAGSIVTKSVDERVTVVGNPARISPEVVRE